MTTEERIAQIAQGFGQGIQNYQQQQNMQRTQQLQDEARRRQEAIQALEVANTLGSQSGRMVDASQLQPLLASGDLTGIGDILQSAPVNERFKAEQDRLSRAQQLQDLQAQKLQQDIRQSSLPFSQTREGQKLAFTESIKKQQEATPKARLEKQGAEARNKIGSIATGLQALDTLGKSIESGYTPSYIDANTPVIGGLISDNPLTESQRIISEVVGRLQSGGAINKEEEKRFMALGPRPGDSPERAKAKIEQQRDFLNNKLAAFGFKGEELPDLGFMTQGRDVAPKEQNRMFDMMTGQLLPQTATASDPQQMQQRIKSMTREEKIRLLQGGM